MVFFSSFKVNGQIKLALGVKVGINNSNLTDNVDGKFQPNTNWCGGIFASVIIIKAFVIQPEFLVRKGGAFQNTTNFNTTVSLNYFQIPLLFKLRLPIAGTLFPHIFLGPSFDYLTDSTLTKSST